MEHGANNFYEIIFGPIEDPPGYELDEDHRNLIKWMLDLGANPGEILKGAAENGHPDIIDLVLKYSPEDLQQIDYNEAMIAATKGGYISIIELLLDSGEVDINIIDKALLAAVNDANENDTVQLLLNNDANVNYANDDGITALMNAAIRGYDNIVQLLIDNNADINHTDNNGDTALTLTRFAVNNKNDTVQLLFIQYW